MGGSYRLQYRDWERDAAWATLTKFNCTGPVTLCLSIEWSVLEGRAAGGRSFLFLQ